MQTLELDKTDAPTEQPSQPIVTDDGFVVDLETGEIIGTEISEFNPLTQQQEYAEYIMRRLQKIDANLAHHLCDLARVTDAEREFVDQELERIALLPEMRLFAAQRQNCESMANGLIKKRNWLFEANRGVLLQVAQANTTAKNRTWTSMFGKVALRKLPSQLEVTDEATAVTLAKKLKWTTAIKEAINKSEFKRLLLDLYACEGVKKPKARDVKALQLVTESSTAFALTPERDKMTVDTGLGVEKLSA